jgi:hypothetical protein
MRLKRWESPRRQGRNDKGKGGSARQRQLKKQFKMLSKKLKGGESHISPFFYAMANCQHRETLSLSQQSPDSDTWT